MNWFILLELIHVAFYVYKITIGSLYNAAQRKGICDGRIMAFRQADTKADFCLLPKIITNVTQCNAGLSKR